MPNRELSALQTAPTKSICCRIPIRAYADSSQLGRTEVKKAKKAREQNEAMKKRQLDLLQSRGFKARL